MERPQRVLYVQLWPSLVVASQQAGYQLFVYYHYFRRKSADVLHFRSVEVIDYFRFVAKVAATEKEVIVQADVDEAELAEAKLLMVMSAVCLHMN